MIDNSSFSQISFYIRTKRYAQDRTRRERKLERNKKDLTSKSRLKRIRNLTEVQNCQCHVNFSYRLPTSVGYPKRYIASAIAVRATKISSFKVSSLIYLVCKYTSDLYKNPSLLVLFIPTQPDPVLTLRNPFLNSIPTQTLFNSHPKTPDLFKFPF